MKIVFWFCLRVFRVWVDVLRCGVFVICGFGEGVFNWLVYYDVDVVVLFVGDVEGVGDVVGCGEGVGC